MTTAQPSPAATGSGYQLEGSLLEVCSCDVLCPCWIGEDPDQGTCQSVVAYHLDKGTIRGVDVSGLTLVSVVHIPGNILEGNWRQLVYVDDRSTDEQGEALIDAFGGNLGGPLADLAQLVGQVAGVHDASIDFRLDKGKGTVTVGQCVEASMAPYTDAGGNPMTLANTIFTTIPGSPAYVSKAPSYKRNTSQYGIPDVNLVNHNAVQGQFHFEA